MPSVTYMNQSAPFWDFIASLENQGSTHPFFSQNRNNENNNNNTNNNASDREEEGFGFGPWGWGYPRGFPHRGPPPPPPNEQAPDNNNNDNSNEKEKEQPGEKEADNGEGPSNNSGSDNEGHRGRHGPGRCGGRRGRHGFGPHGHHGGPGGFGPPHHGGPGGFGPHHGPPHHRHGRRGGWGPWSGRGGPFSGAPFNPFDFAHLFDSSAAPERNETQEHDFSPEADIFDTTSAYVVHISLPGAKKEDVGVNWDAEKSELSIAGVVYRPGDEDFLKTLAMNERKVGPFERKIRLGTRANPAQVDAEGISARLEDGVLRVEVPKMEAGFVEVRKVDIE